MDLTATKPSETSNEGRTAFIEFVRKAGEVDPATLPGLVDRAISLVTIHDGDSLIGTAAVKRPSARYRSKTFKKVGDENAAAAHLVEIGWVHVRSDYEGNGHGRRLVEAALKQSGSDGVYATTKNDTMRRMLAKLGFTAVGKDYASKLKPDEKLSLFAREPIKADK